MKCIYFL